MSPIISIKGGLIRWSSWWLGFGAACWVDILTRDNDPLMWWEVALLMASTAIWVWRASCERGEALKAAANAVVDGLCAYLTKDQRKTSDRAPSVPPRVH